MVRYCCANNCKNRYDVKKKDISFHKFPSNNPEVEKSWILAVQKKDSRPTNSSYICSSHFLPEDFEPFLPGSMKRKLKPSAVPSVFGSPSYSKYPPVKKIKILEPHLHMVNEGAKEAYDSCGTTDNVSSSASSVFTPISATLSLRKKMQKTEPKMQTIKTEPEIKEIKIDPEIKEIKTEPEIQEIKTEPEL